VLRNQVDRQRVSTQGSTKQQLLDGSVPLAKVNAKAPARPRAPAAAAQVSAQPKPATQADAPVVPAPCVEVIHGSSRALHCF
jgi:hypothetical protein